jgi:hypothetical protein
VTYDHHREDEARWVEAMRQRHARGQEYVCGLADVMRTLAERDEARAEVERLRSEHKGLVDELARAIDGVGLALSFEQQDRIRFQSELAALRAEIGEAWFADDCDVLTALRRKIAMLQRLADGGGE